MIDSEPNPREQTDGHAGNGRTPDRWLLTGSLIFHLLVFLLLPGFVIEAKQPLLLLVELVQPEVKVVPRPVSSPGKQSSQPVAKPATEAPAAKPDAAEPASVPDSNETEAPAPAITPEVPEPAPAEPEATTSDAVAAEVVPEMVAVPKHQPIVIPKPAKAVVEEKPVEPTPEPVVQPPAPVVKQLPPAPEAKPAVKPEVKPDPRPEPKPETKPAPPEVQPTPPAKVDDAVPDKPATPDVTPGEPVKDSTEPSGQPGAEPAAGEEVAAAPPGPSELELGLLGEYGDGARKKIRMLVRTPERAREKGLKGKCKFEFELRSDGSLASIRVINSSGHSVLDEECLEATRVAAPFKRFPGSVSVGSWKFQMEIVFPTY